jgi:hypothetical protein
MRAFLLKYPKLNKFCKPALPRAFPGEKHVLARAFWIKYDQNYELRGGGSLQRVLPLSDSPTEHGNAILRKTEHRTTERRKTECRKIRNVERQNIEYF